MTSVKKNNLLYLCMLIERISRETRQSPSNVVKSVGKDGIDNLYNYADVNHCLPFQQVVNEAVERYHIPFKNEKIAQKLPSVEAIGREYLKLITSAENSEESLTEAIMKVFTSIVSDAISNYESSFYYSGSGYIRACYEAREILM